MRVRSKLTGLGAVLCVLLGASQVQAQSWDTYVGGSLGDTDYGTGLKGFAGMQVAPRIAVEGQLMSFGSETYSNFGNANKRSAWALGASGIGQLPLSAGFGVFGKLGLHYLRSEASGPGTSVSENGLKLGLGVGAAWHFNPKIGLRAEFENVGGSGGDVLSLGLQFKL